MGKNWFQSLQNARGHRDRQEKTCSKSSKIIAGTLDEKTLYERGLVVECSVNNTTLEKLSRVTIQQNGPNNIIKQK
jgi:hypothetical protein